MGLVAGLLWHGLPGSTRTPRIRINAVRHTYRFAAGITVITAAMLGLTQLDRIVLSRLVSLDEFGYFVVAALVGYGLTALARPVFTATYPRFSALAASHDAPGLKHVYRRAWQLMMMLVVPAAAVIAAFSSDLLFVWTHSRTVAHVAGPIAAIPRGWHCAQCVDVCPVRTATRPRLDETDREGQCGADTDCDAGNRSCDVTLRNSRSVRQSGLRQRGVHARGSADHPPTVIAGHRTRLVSSGSGSVQSLRRFWPPSCAGLPCHVANDPGWIVMEVAVAWSAAEIALILSNTDLRGRLKGLCLTMRTFRSQSVIPGWRVTGTVEAA